jgi:hypothetical protein
MLAQNRDRPVCLLDYMGLYSQISESKINRFLKKRLIKLLEKEIGSMKIKFYSEFTDKYYDTSMECVEAERKFKEEQQKRERQMSEIKRKADEVSRRITEIEAKRLNDEQREELTGKMDEGYNAIVAAVKAYTKTCNEYFNFVKRTGDKFETAIVEYMIKMCKDFLGDEEEEEDE